MRAAAILLLVTLLLMLGLLLPPPAGGQATEYTLRQGPFQGIVEERPTGSEFVDDADLVLAYDMETLANGDMKDFAPAKGLRPDGGWNWYGRPTALRYRGNTYVGSMPSSGDAVINQYNHTNFEVRSFVLQTALDPGDDHGPPGIVAMPDGIIKAFYSAHAGDVIYSRNTTNPEDITSWDTEWSFTPGNPTYTYMSPFILSGESDRLYLIYRQTYGAEEGPAYITSDDGGSTWSSSVRIWDGGTSASSHYWQHWTDGGSRIYFAFNEGHPYHVTHNNVSFAYYEDGNFYRADGTLAKAVGDLPLTPADVDLVWNSSAEAENKTWVWSVGADASDNPIITFAAFNTTTDHRYRYARWNGSAWNHYEITAGGQYITVGGDAASKYYSGGVVLDHRDVNAVYISNQTDTGVWDIERWTTADSGQTWEFDSALTQDSGSKSLRPTVPWNASDVLPVVWLNGTYTEYSFYDQTVWTTESYSFMDTFDGEITGTTSSTGLFGDALDFNGTSDYISAGTMSTAGQLLDQGFTLATWLHSDDTTDAIAIVGTINDAGSTMVSVVLNRDGAYQAGAGRIRLYMREEGGLFLAAGVTSNTGITDGSWHSLIVEAMPTVPSVSILVDGVSQSITWSQQTAISEFANFQYSLTVGARNSRGIVDSYFEGTLDDTLIFLGTLTDQQRDYLSNYVNYTLRFNTTVPSDITSGPTWVRGIGQTMGAAVNSSSTDFTINITTWDSGLIAWDSYTNVSTITTRYNFTLGASTNYPYFVDGTQEGTFTTDDSGEGSFDWTSWTTHQFQIGEAAEEDDGGTGGPGAPKILLTTSTAYFGWNTVILNADAIVEKSGGPDPDEVLFYRWDMGDGTIRTGPEVTHSYDVRWFWSVYDVTLDVCTAGESVCETRDIPIFLVFWPAVYGLILITLAILILLGLKMRWRIVRL